MIFNSRLSQCLDVPDLPDEDWPPSVARFLRIILWSLTAGFFDVLMFQTYLMKTDHPLLSVSWEWSLTAGFLDVLMFQTYLMKTDHPLLFISSEWSHDLWQQAFLMSWCSRPTWWRLTTLCCPFPENDLMIFNSRLFCCLDVHNLRTILWSLTAGFLDVLMLQTYLMKTDHPLLSVSCMPEGRESRTFFAAIAA